VRPFKKRNLHRINEDIRAPELRLIGAQGESVGVVLLEKALEMAEEAGLDLVEISADAKPPVAKIIEYGKFLYELQKKKKRSGAGKATETKSVQVKIGTGEHDLALKAKNASKWLSEGHRIKVELYLSGRSKYMEEAFLKERLNRILNLITEDYKIAESCKKSPKGLALTIERAKK